MYFRLFGAVLVTSCALSLSCSDDGTSGGAGGSGGDSGGSAGSGGTPGTGKVAWVSVTPSAVLLTSAADTQQIRVVAYDEAGNAFVAPSVKWTSTHADIVEIRDGAASSTGAIGSSLLVAEVDGVQSAPVFALSATPAANALLLDDADVIAVAPVEPVTPIQASWTVDTTGEPPAIGTIVLAHQSYPVMGRVQAAAKTADGARITLDRVPIQQAFTAFSIDERVPVARGGVSVSHDVGGMMTNSFALGPFECEAEAGKKVTIAPSWTPSLPQVDLDYDLVFSPFASPAHVKMFLTGNVTHQVAMSVEVSIGAEAEFKCQKTLRRFPLPIGGPIGAFVGLNVPVGVGFSAKVALEAGATKAGVSGKVGFEMALGFERKNGVTTDLSDVKVINELVPEFEAPTIGSSFRFKASFFPHLFAGIDGGVAAAEDLNFSILRAKGGISAELDSSFLGIQASDPAYASNYGLKLALEVGPGSDAQKVLSLFDEQLALEPKLVFNTPIARSPTGAFSASRAAVALGGSVTFTATMDPANATFLSVENIDKVEIREVAADGSVGPVVQELIPQAGSLTASWTWTPSDADLGDHTFAAFVRPVFFGFIPLEISGDTRRSVYVHRPGEVPPTKQVKYKWQYLTEMIATAMNNDGVVVGQQISGTGGKPPQAVRVANGVFSVLPNTIDPNLYSVAYDVNDAGTIVGGVNVYAITGVKAVMWAGGSMTELVGTPPPDDPANHYNVIAAGINNSGDVVGRTEETGLGAYPSLARITATMWSQGGAPTPLGAPYNLYMGPKDARDAWRINDVGQVLASASAYLGAFGGGPQGFSIWEAGGWTNTTAANGHAINILGQVAGCIDAAGPHAAIFSQGAGIDIDPDTTGQWASQARGINDLGVVVAERSPKSSNGPHYLYVYAGGTFERVEPPQFSTDWVDGITPPNLSSKDVRVVDIDNSGRILVQMGSAAALLTPEPN